MNIPVRPPGPEGLPEGWINLTKLADRIEKYVKLYRWLTYANVTVFGTNAVVMTIYMILRYWLGH